MHASRSFNRVTDNLGPAPARRNRSEPALALLGGAQRLRRDEVGAVLVPAIVMGALLVGMLFYVAAVGDAIVFRTQLQDAADVTAFKSATWHATGMNILVVLNVLMAIALSFFVLWRLAEALLLVLAFIPPATGFALNAEARLVQNEDKIARALDVVMKTASAAQAGASSVIPYVALYQAKRQPTAADTVWPVTTSLIPPLAADRALQRLTDTEGRFPLNGPAALPVQEDKFERLCTEAAMVWPEQIMSIVDQTFHLGPVVGGLFANSARAVVDVLADGSNGALCQPIKGLAMDAVEGVTDDLSQQGCAAQEQKEREEAEAAREKDENAPKPKDWTPRQRRQCERDKRREVNKNRARSSSQVRFEVTPLKVWDVAANGGPFMSAWSYVEGSPRLFAGDQVGMGLADKGRAPAVQPSRDGVAMAEFYFEQEGSWSDPEFEPFTMWRPKWTARIRRYHSPQEQFLAMGLAYPLEKINELQDQAAELAGEKLIDFGFKMLKSRTGLDVSEDSFVTRFLKDKIQEAPGIKQLNELIASMVSGVSEEAGLEAFIDKYANPRQVVEEDRVH